MKTENTKSTIDPTTPDTIDAQRRNITKLAFWTPPVMMTLMLSSRNSAASAVPGVTSEAAPASVPYAATGSTFSGYNN